MLSSSLGTERALILCSVMEMLSICLFVVCSSVHFQTGILGCFAFEWIWGISFFGHKLFTQFGMFVYGWLFNHAVFVLV